MPDGSGLPQNPMVNIDKLHARGLALNRDGDYTQALRFFLQAAALAPNSPCHLISAANMCAKLQHPEPARELYLKAVAHPALSEKLRRFAEEKLKQLDVAVRSRRGSGSICAGTAPAAAGRPASAAPPQAALERLRLRYGDEDLLAADGPLLLPPSHVALEGDPALPFSSTDAWRAASGGEAKRTEN